MSGPHRRGVLAGMAALSGGAGMAALTPAPALARDPRGARPLAVFDTALAPRAARLAQLLDAELVRLEPGVDPMRLWRAEIAPRLDAGAPILGATRWSDYVVLRGSAAESRLRARLEIGPDGTEHRAPGAEAPALAGLADRFRTVLSAAPDASGGRIDWILA